MMKYKHIFDYFDKDGKYIGGCEPLTNTTLRPTGLKLQHPYHVQSYTVYVGWCYQNEPIYSGCYFPDVTKYDKNTKQLIPITEDNKTTEHSTTCMSYEECCQFKGISPLPKYLKHKEEKENKFKEEYHKCINDIEYFRKKYYNKSYE